MTYDSSERTEDRDLWASGCTESWCARLLRVDPLRAPIMAWSLNVAKESY